MTRSAVVIFVALAVAVPLVAAQRFAGGWSVNRKRSQTHSSPDDFVSTVNANPKQILDGRPPVRTRDCRRIKTADSSIAKDRVFRQSLLSSGKNVPAKPKWGFFGTIFTVILEQINDTKSAYNQISDLVNNNFADDNAVPATTDATTNTTEATKITRREFLQILDRNLKGLARLRNLEWREAKKDSRANMKEYWNEIFSGKKTRSTG